MTDRERRIERALSVPYITTRGLADAFDTDHDNIPFACEWYGIPIRDGIIRTEDVRRAREFARAGL